MSDKNTLSFNEQLLEEILNEMETLDESQLDTFLTEIGLSPAGLLDAYAASTQSALLQARRARFEDARTRIRRMSSQEGASKITMLDFDRKKTILAAISDRTLATKEMTIAARNQSIESEQDLDSFLEACVNLGVINDNGDLKI